MFSEQTSNFHLVTSRAKFFTSKLNLNCLRMLNIELNFIWFRV